jgi:astacin (peptidase family M12A)/caspase domain-containing protein
MMRTLSGFLILSLVLVGCGKEPGSIKVLTEAPPSTPTGKVAPAALAVDIATPAIPIQSGTPETGTLGQGDATSPDGRFYDTWILEGAPGTEVRVSLTSTEFDTLVRVVDDRGGEFSDDDSGDDTNSDLTLVMAGYELEIIVTGYDADQAGAYQLSVDAVSRMLTINRNESVEGRLEDLDEEFEGGRFYDLWAFTGSAGEVVTVDLQSGEFDALVSLRTAPPGQGIMLGEDDDSGDAYNSRLENQELPADGSYVIVVTSYEAARGSYQLTLQSSGGRGPGIGTPTGDPNDKYALLVGIGDYNGTAADLSSSPVDVAAMATLLEDDLGFRPGNIRILRDAEATRDGILTAFREHLGLAGPDGIALFYYTGHGTQVGENLGLTAPLDPEPDGQDEALFVWGEGGMSSIILDDELGYMSDQLLAERTLILIDACFSGTGTRAQGARAKALKWSDVASKTIVPGAFEGENEWADLVVDDRTIQIDDMIFADRQVRALSKGQLTFGIELWPDGVVPYSFADEITEEMRDRFRQGAAEWEASGVRFTEHTDEANSVRVQYLPPEDSLASGKSFVGVYGGEQGYWLARDAMGRTIVHELGHVLGLKHEQTRGDRDAYVSIKEENVYPDYMHNFTKLGGVPCSEYDFGSIMHYPAYAFSTNGEDTIVAKPRYAVYQDRMGSQTMSTNDRESVRRLYSGQCEASPGTGGVVAVEGEPVQHVLISASDDDSEAWISGSLPGEPQVASVFTYYLTRAFAAADPTESLESLAMKVSRETDAHDTSIGVPVQTPGIEGARKRLSIGYYLGLND